MDRERVRAVTCVDRSRTEGLGDLEVDVTGDGQPVGAAIKARTERLVVRVMASSLVWLTGCRRAADWKHDVDNGRGVRGCSGLEREWGVVVDDRRSPLRGAARHGRVPGDLGVSYVF